MSRSYRFADFCINPALRELWRGDRLVALPPPVFDCMTYLLEHRDRAVGRDELVAAVWGKTDISDTQLGQTILRIRRELGDDAKESRILRTIPRFGYRWVAPVEASEAADVASEAAPAIDAPPAPQPAPEAAQPAAPADVVEPAPAASVITTAPKFVRRFTSKHLYAVLAVVALLAVAVGLPWFVRQHRPASTVAPEPARGDGLVSAVLPAVVESGAEWAWMRLGMMDAVAGQLRSSGLPSVPSEDVVALLKAPEGARPEHVRTALAAHLLVTPRVQRSAADWQVDLDADDGAGGRYHVAANAHDAAAAARAAADRLLVALGRRPVESKEESADAALVRRIDAAALADDLDAARALIAQASPEEQQSPQVRLRLAKIDYRAGNLDAAEQRLSKMLDEAPAETAPVLRASILNGLGSVALAREQPQQADRFYGEAIALLESHNEPEQLGQAFIGRAAAATDLAQFVSAAADFARARIAYRQANDALALIRVATDEGIADYLQGRPARALTQLTAASDGFKQWGAVKEAILTYVYQIACHLALLEGNAAMQAADAAEELAQRIDNRNTLNRLSLARARALAAVGRLREARDVLDALRSAGADTDMIGAADAALAGLELDDNKPVVAAELAGHAVQVLAAANAPRTRSDAWLTQIRAQLRERNPAQAQTTLAAFETWAATIKDARATLFAQLARAEYVHRTGASDWRKYFEGPRDETIRDGLPSNIAAVAGSFADALLAEGDLDAAAVEVGRLSRWAEQDFACAVLEARLYAATGRNEARQTAVARARGLAGERPIPEDALSIPVSTRSVKQ